MILGTFAIIGLFGYLIAAIIAFRNFEHTNFSKNWFFFGVASVSAVLWSIVLILNDFGMNLDLLQTNLLFFMSIMLALYSLVTYFSHTKPLGKN